jgi:hypothetical protein
MLVTWQCTCGIFTLVITEKLFYLPLNIPYAKMGAQPIEQKFRN